jgi:DMSO/TMAO reductase YedYZ heme-binding membrane subunit
VGFYLWALLVGSFYIRKRIGNKTWRWIHFSSFLTFAMVIIHGIASGSDTKALWASGLYWIAGASLLFLLYYRILVVSTKARAGEARAIRERELPSRSTSLERRASPIPVRSNEKQL